MSDVRTAAEKRFAERRRTRLRSGKIADLTGRFIIECAVHDRSQGGARLRRVAQVPVPASICLYDDATNTLVPAAVVWERGLDLGVRFTPEVVVPAEKAIRFALGGRYYALA
jgi:hypothetical protein